MQNIHGYVYMPNVQTGTHLLQDGQDGLLSFAKFFSP